MPCQDTFSLTDRKPSTVKPHRRHAVRQVVAAVVMLATTVCEQTDSVPNETSADDWCVDGSKKVMGFRLENGKTVSICEATGASELIYTYGVLGEEPELVYRGPRLGSFEAGLLGAPLVIATDQPFDARSWGPPATAMA